MIRVVAFDLMDTVVRDPYRDALRAATGLSLDELFARRPPHVYPALERDELAEDDYWAAFADHGIDVDPDAFHRARLAGTSWLDGMAELLDGLAGVVVRATASNYPRWVDELARTLLAGRFDRVIASCHLGARKPDARFYRALLDELACAPHEVLFVDDREENVTGARELGIAGHRFRDAAGVRAFLAEHGVSVRDSGRGAKG
ncbi:HAD-IA family hydrolase [Egicoccus sp. AB-alg6-2]|uniref:HAD-IA family hydrolase n=1 Tax=Egicoccus sp. AB-alg6-2 TaxID=3242692 RepID=UPI00359DCB34